jgi:hypothetical protein
MSDEMSDVSTTTRRGSSGAARRGARPLRRCLFVVLTAWGVSELPRVALGLETLVLSRAKLRYDISVRGNNGALKIKALVDDNSTVGQLRLGLLAGTVAADISDSGQFNLVLPLTGCKLTSSEGVRCRSSDGTVRANFVPTAQGPYIYNMRISARRLPDTLTGTALPVGPVSVVLHQPGADRADVISACAADSLTTLVCRDP